MTKCEDAMEVVITAFGGKTRVEEAINVQMRVAGRPNR